MLTGATVNAAPALGTPLTVTTTLPVVAPVGTETAIEVALQAEAVAAVPLNVTVLVPWVAPKFVPVIDTGAPTAAEDGDRLLIIGAGTTVNAAPALDTPPTVTTTLPVVAPVGTGATIEVALQLVGVAAVPLNVTVLVPCVAPKFVPAIVTGVPTPADDGDKALMVGVANTVNVAPVLETPPTVTTTGPVDALAGTGTAIEVALQLVGVPAVPLNVTVLEPCVAPKFVPAIVIDVPATAVNGTRLVMVGVGGGGLLDPPLPHPEKPTVRAAPRQQTPAFLATSLQLTRRRSIRGRHRITERRTVGQYGGYGRQRK
jgi:hypothetical protein